MSVNDVLQAESVEDYFDSLFQKCATADEVVGMELLLTSHIRQYSSLRIAMITTAEQVLSEI